MARPAHAQVVQDAVEAFEPDRRVLALWLEGSLASGEDDAASDVDLHLAIADEEFESFVSDRAGLLGKIRPPVAFIEVEAPWGLLLPSTLEGLVR